MCVCVCTCVLVCVNLLFLSQHLLYYTVHCITLFSQLPPQSLKYRVSDCKSQFMDSFAHLEECKSMLNRRREPRLAEYRRRRPLDPVLKGKKDDLLSRHSKLRVTIQ